MRPVASAVAVGCASTGVVAVTLRTCTVSSRLRAAPTGNGGGPTGESPLLQKLWRTLTGLTSASMRYAALTRPYESCWACSSVDTKIDTKSLAHKAIGLAVVVATGGTSSWTLTNVHESEDAGGSLIGFNAQEPHL